MATILFEKDQLVYARFKHSKAFVPCKYVAHTSEGHLVKTESGELMLSKECREREAVLPPSEHFNGATQFQVIKTRGVWRKGDIVKYVGSDRDGPLQWTFEKLYPPRSDRRRAAFTSKIHFNNLTPIITIEEM